MKIKNRLVKFTTPIHRDDYSYWLMHIVSYLECLNDHKLFTIFPPTDIKQFWTLSDFRGALQNGELYDIRNKIKNWGAQYYLANLFNFDSFYKSFLINELSNFLNKNIEEVKIVVSGKDSTHGFDFLTDESNDYRFYFDKRRRIKTSKDLIQYADLCFLITDNGGIFSIFGEVEGNHGKKLLNYNFWINKGRHIHIGIGLIDSNENYIRHEILNFDGRDRLIILFPSSKSVLADFDLMVDTIENLIQQGPRSGKWWIRFDSECLREAIGYLYNNFNTSILHILGYLKGDISHSQTVKIYNSYVPIDENLNQPHNNLTIPELIHNKRHTKLQN